MFRVCDMTITSERPTSNLLGEFWVVSNQIYQPPVQNQLYVFRKLTERLKSYAGTVDLFSMVERLRSVAMLIRLLVD